jgi:hypothetical protein
VLKPSPLFRFSNDLLLLQDTMLSTFLPTFNLTNEKDSHEQTKAKATTHGKAAH